MGDYHGYYGSSQSFPHSYSHGASCSYPVGNYWESPSLPPYGQSVYPYQSYMPHSVDLAAPPVHPEPPLPYSPYTPPPSFSPSFASFEASVDRFLHLCSQPVESVQSAEEAIRTTTRAVERIEDHVQVILKALAEEREECVVRDQVGEREESVVAESDDEGEVGESILEDSEGEMGSDSQDGCLVEFGVPFFGDERDFRYDLDSEEIEPHDPWRVVDDALFEDLPVDPEHGDEIGGFGMICEAKEVPTPPTHQLSHDSFIEPPSEDSFFLPSLEAEVIYPDLSLPSSYFRCLTRLFPLVPLRNLHIRVGVG